jgi:hypothetical protein
MFDELLSGLRFVKSEHAILAALSLDPLLRLSWRSRGAAAGVRGGDSSRSARRASASSAPPPPRDAVTMGIFLAHRPPFQRAGRDDAAGGGRLALSIIGFGLSRDFYLSLALLALSGMADNVSVVIRSTLIQLLTPPPA